MTGQLSYLGFVETGPNHKCKNNYKFKSGSSIDFYRNSIIKPLDLSFTICVFPTQVSRGRLLNSVKNREFRNS